VLIGLATFFPLSFLQIMLLHLISHLAWNFRNIF